MGIGKIISIKKGFRGFIVIDILISALILTSSIAATMYLFRMGFVHLERANQSNLLSSKLIQATGLLKFLDMEEETGEENLGEGITMRWKAQLLRASRPVKGEGTFSIPPLHELLLYRVEFKLIYREIEREYQVNVLRHKPLLSPEEMVF